MARVEGGKEVGKVGGGRMGGGYSKGGRRERERGKGDVETGEMEGGRRMWRIEGKKIHDNNGIGEKTRGGGGG